MSGEMLDKMYIDFTEKVIPMVQDGMQITKEYFADLFTRYVQYLLLTDILAGIIWLIVGIVAGTIAYKLIKSYRQALKNKIWSYDSDAPMAYMLGITLSLFLFLGAMTSVYHNTTNAIKAVFIPEVRVYEELQSMRSNQNN